MGRARGEEILTVCVDVEKLEALVRERGRPHNEFNMTPALFRRWIEQGAPTWQSTSPRSKTPTR